MPLFFGTPAIPGIQPIPPNPYLTGPNLTYRTYLSHGTLSIATNFILRDPLLSLGTSLFHRTPPNPRNTSYIKGTPPESLVIQPIPRDFTYLLGPLIPWDLSQPTGFNKSLGTRISRDLTWRRGPYLSFGIQPIRRDLT